METTRINEQDYTDLPTMLMALEISDKKWQVLFRRAGSTRERRKALLAWDLVELKGQIEAAKAKLGLPADARVMSCYEAGRDAFSIHRWLVSIGVDSRLDASVGHTGVARRLRALGDEHDRGPGARRRPRRRQTGSAAADHENIVLESFVVGHGAVEFVEALKHRASKCEY